MSTDIPINPISGFMVMPGRRRGSYSRGIRPIINSIKNQTNAGTGITSTVSTTNLVVAVDAPAAATNSEQVLHGCVIKAFWFSFDVCGLGGTGVLNIADAYIMKNPGANLTPPDPAAVGTSNEKKFVFKTWRAMIMRNQDGNVPYHWEGWIKIPKRYQRFGTDDSLSFNIRCTASVTGHMSWLAIYKWYT